MFELNHKMSVVITKIKSGKKYPKTEILLFSTVGNALKYFKENKTLSSIPINKISKNEHQGFGDDVNGVFTKITVEENNHISGKIF